MDVNQSRFDHKSCVPGRSRSCHRVWWALHGWGISNGWRLRRVHEAAEAETNDWYHYPSGRVYYTSLRNHMKELVSEIIEEAQAEGWQSTRRKPGPKCARLERAPQTRPHSLCLARLSPRAGMWWARRCWSRW